MPNRAHDIPYINHGGNTARSHPRAASMTVRFCDNCGIIQGCCNLLRHLDVTHTIEVVAHVAPQDTSEKRGA